MEQVPDKLEAIIEKSIQLEEKGFQYYTESAAKVKNSLGKRTLERLANDEKNHIKRFKQIFEAVSNQKVDDLDLGSVPPTTFDEIFNRLQDQLDNAVEEMSETGVDDAEVIEMALDLENTTKFFYEEAAKKTDIPKVKKLYEMLAKEEQAHYDVLRKMLEFFDDPSLFFGMAGSQRF